jgi:hypothetical protein
LWDLSEVPGPGYRQINNGYEVPRENGAILLGKMKCHKNIEPPDFDPSDFLSQPL